ncbi:MAG: hypothetical protein PHT17_02180 [Proteiniphilum sp.]|nr:hypothetical protein [Proteiniphilum sp.]
MRKIYISLAILACTAGITAQTQDSLLRRQLELERDFNPTLLDADKINSLPALREPVVQKANTNYSPWAERITPPLEIALPRPGNIMTAIPYHTQKGYLSFQAGNYANVDGAFGYRLLEKERQSLAFSFTHQSTNGQVEYIQRNTPENSDAFFMDNRGELAFRHNGDANDISLNLSYLHSRFNYYGNRFGNEAFFNEENQRLGVLQASLGVASKESDLLNYKGALNLKNFSTGLAYPALPDPLRGNEIQIMAGFDKPFRNSSSKVGIDGSLTTALYGDDWNNYMLVNAAPYLRFGGLNRSARLGADILFQTGNKTRVRVVPNIALRMGITERTSLYANIHGGFIHNTFLDLMGESRYILPATDVRPSFSIVDMDAGLRIGEVDGFRFDLFGGFRKTDDAHFLLLHGVTMNGDEVPGPFVEGLKPVYGDLAHTHLGGMIHAKSWAPLELSLRVKKNFYTVKNLTVDESSIADPKAYNKPGMEIDLKGVLEVSEQLRFSMNYYFAGERWSYYEGENLQMENINDLNLGAAYQISNAFSLSIKANNLMFQHYDLWYGHPAQGFNVMGGFTFCF